MGLILGKLWDGWMAGGEPRRMLMVGLDAAGKVNVMGQSGTFIDEPNTTSATTYKVQALVGGGGTVFFGRDKTGSTNNQHTRSIQRITLMEVAV